ncbi:hypothetical protein LTR37_009472 [Vermiconidia calcicola]|uniref:Uncharacterized protein n=1 Tax=Vermiconidia calcicola TaxID=1690605 RepID=A0ACC3N9E8_9PEZI|nr:hypothetical protein LTR37_009472 [Vermiconidia calcicola]
MAAMDILRWMPNFFYSQFFVTPKVPSTDCSGKTIIVTGANVGLGKEAARHYVRLGASKIILACRSRERGEAAKNDIEATTKRKGVVEVWQLDLGSYESVNQFAERAKTLKRLDSIVENAGISTTNYKSVEGNESTVTVNVVSTFLLALLILPKLQETAKNFNITPNLCIVSSEVHFVTAFPERTSSSIFGTLNDEKQARMTDRYNVSKLLEVLACREVTRQHPVNQMKVTMNFVNPGWCHSELMREMTNPILGLVKKLFCRTTEVGSRTLVHAGVAGPETHGQYMSDCQITRCAPLVEGKEGAQIQRSVWDELATKLDEIEPGILKVLDT